MNDIMAVHILRQLEQQTHLQKRQADALDRMARAQERRADAAEKLAGCVGTFWNGQLESYSAFRTRGWRNI